MKKNVPFILGNIPGSQYQDGEYITMNIRLGMAMIHDDLNSEKNLKGIASSALALLRTPTSLRYTKKEGKRHRKEEKKRKL